MSVSVANNDWIMGPTAPIPSEKAPVEQAYLLKDNPIQSFSTLSDKRITEFMKTHWKNPLHYLVNTKNNKTNKINYTNKPETKTNFSPPTYEIGKKIPPLLNQSLKSNIVPRNNDLSSSSGYFPSHTWSSSFGPNDVNTKAVPVVPTLEGHWFPKESYARIYYRAFLWPGMKMHFRVERDQDIFSRYLRVYFGSTKVFEKIIINFQQPRWAYGLFAHRVLDKDGFEMWGLGLINQYFRIGDFHSSDYSDRFIILHEFGHVEGMHDDSGGTYDVYGSNPSLSDPFYCSYSWEEEHLAWVRSWW